MVSSVLRRCWKCCDRSFKCLCYYLFPLAFTGRFYLYDRICLFRTAIFEKRIAKATQDVSDFSNQALGKTTDFFNGFEVFYHNIQGNYFKTQILNSFKALINPKVTLARLSATANSISMMASIIAQVVMFIVTGYLIIHGEVTTGVIFSIANLTSCLFNYTRCCLQYCHLQRDFQVNG